MTFEKPKVTIDLEEYNFLNNKIEELKKELSKDVNKDDIDKLQRISGTILNFIGSKDDNAFNNIMLKIEHKYKVKPKLIVDNSTVEFNCKLIL